MPFRSFDPDKTEITAADRAKRHSSARLRLTLVRCAIPFLLITSVAQAQTLDLDEFFERPALKGTLSGAIVNDGDGNVLYERNADLRMMPASNQKILTAVYALLVRGPEYVGELRLWKSGTVLYAEALGHPMLTFTQLKVAREHLKVPAGATLRLKAPYRSVVPPSWEFDDLPNRYAAQPSAFSVDRGGFELWNAGGKAVLRPANYGVKIESGTRLSYDPTRAILQVPSLPKENKRLDTLAVPNSESSAAMALGARLIEGSAAMPNRPPDLVLKAPPLSEIVRECLQKSDNFLAETLLLNTASSEGPYKDPRDPYAEAGERMKKRLIEAVGLDAGDLRPMDGSGLSRHNLVTPRALAKVLLYADRSWPSWRSWLAGPGEGTLASRLDGSAFRGKTGSLNSVSALSGLSTSISGKTLAISLVFNHTLVSQVEIRGLQDAIVRKIEINSGGTDFEDSYDCERSHPHPRDSAFHWYRSYRSGGDGGASRTGSDRRTQSAHARFYRAERVALRIR